MPRLQQDKDTKDSTSRILKAIIDSTSPIEGYLYRLYYTTSTI